MALSLRLSRKSPKKENRYLQTNPHKYKNYIDRAVFADPWGRGWVINNALGILDYPFETI